jgi:D-alanyl-D-alanine carboxypeptidase
MQGMDILANDIAQALAIWDSGSEAAFARKMNGQVARWGLHETTL